jgi:hypothetical protein
VRDGTQGLVRAWQAFYHSVLLQPYLALYFPVWLTYKLVTAIHRAFICNCPAPETPKMSFYSWW